MLSNSLHELSILLSRSTRRRKQQAGFALIATISVMVLLVMIALAMLSLSTIELRQTSHSNAQAKAQANARMALQIALAQLQKYAGPDQRVTARADITDADWTQLDSNLSNPFYTLVWDVSGSEMDFTPNGTLDLSTTNHRPGMNPGHDFTKKPAVLVSGNEKFNLTNSTGNIDKTTYPSGYVEPTTNFSSFPSITIVPQSLILTEDGLAGGNSTSKYSITVPLVTLSNNSMYAWWIGDESIKARINTGLRHDKNSIEAKMLAQRPTINPYQKGLDSSTFDNEEASKIISTLTTPLAFQAAKNSSFSYSPDITTSSTSLLTDTRNAGLKKDFTFALYQPDTDPNIPQELKNDASIFDSISQNNGPEGGLDCRPEYWRNYATFSVSPDNPVPIGQNDIAPVMSQVQASIHAAIKPIPGTTKFQIYFSVFPSITFWNPYNVPIKLDKKITISQYNRGMWNFYNHHYLYANYSILHEDGTKTSFGGFFRTLWDDRWSREGWNFKMYFDPSQESGEVILPPGKAMVFSPKDIVLDDNIAAHKENLYKIRISPGWHPGKGLLFNLDGQQHDASQYTTNNKYPKISIGLGGAALNNLEWKATILNNGKEHFLSVWSRLQTSKTRDNTLDSAFFPPPQISDLYQDTRGGFPSLLYKFALRMGEEQTLPIATGFIRSEQKTLLFPYLANYNPRAVFHSAIAAPRRVVFWAWPCDSLKLPPSLMGAYYDFQTAQNFYTVPTTAANNGDMFTFIGNGYYGDSEKMILSEVLPKLTAPNSTSGHLTSFTQLNSSQTTLGDYSHYTAYDWFGTSNYPTYPIGNSLADFRLNTLHKKNIEEENPKGDNTIYYGSMAKEVTRGYRHVPAHLYDLSYLLNDFLYDHYFFSTIPQKGGYEKDQPLINPHLQVSTEDISLLRSIESAKFLKLLGGFNVNSTSIPAWEMLLSSALGIQRNNVDSSQNVAFAPRLDSDEATFTIGATEKSASSGDSALVLTPAQIKKLAEAIVAQVKRRGPFPSVAAFVNRTNFMKDLLRQNGVNKDVGQRNLYQDVRFSGTLQAAIDATKEINDKLDTQKTISSNDYYSGKDYPNIESLRKSANSHLPGYLKQSDILRQIDPLITVRGDTFIIRTVGVTKDKNGKILAKAACEAVVQRTFNYIDSSDTPEKAPYEITGNVGNKTLTWKLSSVNRRFGRKFKIISFKWLPQDEVVKMKIQ